MPDVETIGARDPELSLLWGDVLGIVREELSEPTFKTWFTQASPSAIEDDMLFVAVPNEFARGWVERYRPLLVTALGQVTGREMGVTFCVNAEVHPEPAAPPLTARESPADSSASVAVAPRKEAAEESPFDAGMTFETFVMGDSNQAAYQAAMSVAEAPGKAYNPLFIYGGVGLGKTHLLHAIANYVRSHYPHMRVRYVSTEQFVNEFIDSIGDRQRVEGFRQRYRTNDVLLVDDVQFLAKFKEGTQDSFFHTFNTLYEARRQIVLASDRPPSEISTLEERLRSRLMSGLFFDIQPPDLETRIAILRRKMQTERTLVDNHVPDDVLEFVASRVSTSIRELNSALMRVVFWGSLSRQPITIELAERALGNEFAQHQSRPISVSTIQQEVCRFYNITRADIIGNKRSQSIVYPRQVAMYLTRDLTDLSLPRIGGEFGGRDHTTVLHAISKIQKLMKEHRDIYDQVMTLAAQVRQKN